MINIEMLAIAHYSTLAATESIYYLVPMTGGPELDATMSGWACWCRNSPMQSVFTAQRNARWASISAGFDNKE